MISLPPSITSTGPDGAKGGSSDWAIPHTDRVICRTFGAAQAFRSPAAQGSDGAYRPRSADQSGKLTAAASQSPPWLVQRRLSWCLGLRSGAAGSARHVAFLFRAGCAALRGRHGLLARPAIAAPAQHAGDPEGDFQTEPPAFLHR